MVVSLNTNIERNPGNKANRRLDKMGQPELCSNRSAFEYGARGSRAFNLETVVSVQLDYKLRAGQTSRRLAQRVSQQGTHMIEHARILDAL